MTMASGPLTSGDGVVMGLKFFLAACENDNFMTAESGSLYLFQLSVLSSSSEITVTLKTTNTKSDGGLRFLEYLTNVFKSYGLRP